MSLDNSADPVGRLAEDFMARYRRGERPSLSEYTRGHPDLAERIRQVFPMMVLMEEADPDAGASAGAPGDDGRADTPCASPCPEQVGGYRIVREVGRGGMGAVYEAVQESLGRHVALKVLPPAAAGRGTFLARFRREAKAAARLHHTNIVPVFGVGEDNGIHYYAMQFIHGQGLDAVLEDVKRLQGDPTAAEATPPPSAAQRLFTGPFAGAAAPATPGAGATGSATGPSGGTRSGLTGCSVPRYYREVARLGVQAAEGLAHAHGQGVLHRDIKPSNLLLDLQGALWITDFGLAKTGDGEDLTETGDLVGTLRYMAPERYRGEADPRSDVYALGVTLYEMLTLRQAFPGDDRVRLIERITQGTPPRPRQLAPDIPRDLETIVLKAMAREPAARYVTAEALADDLHRFLEDRPIRARRATALERTWRWCRRNPALAAVSTLAVASLLGATVLSINFAIHQSRAATNLRTALDDAEFHREANKQAAEDLRRQQQQTKTALGAMTLARGLNSCEQGNVSLGMLWLARALEIATEADDADLQRVIRWNLAGWYRKVHPLRAAFPLHPGLVWAAALSPDGKVILTGSADKTARLWDAATGHPLGPPLRHPDEVRAVAFSPDGKTVVTGSHDGTARLWDADTGQPLGQPLRHQDRVNAVAFSPDGKVVLTGSGDKTARLWDAATGRVILSLRGHTETVVSVAFSPDGKTVATGGGYRMVKLWDAATGKPLGLHPGKLQHSICAIVFSPDGKCVLTGGSDFTARLWEAATGLPLGPPLQHQGQVYAVAFSPDGKMVLTGSNDKTARLWDVATGQPLGEPLRHPQTVYAVAFRPDGKTALTGSADGEVRLWELASREVGSSLSPLPRQRRVWAMAFSPDGKTALTGGTNGTAWVWDAATGKPIGNPLRHPNSMPVAGVAFSPDGKTALTGSPDKTARLWEAATGRLLHTLPHELGVETVAFSPDGKTVLTGSGDNDAAASRLWDAATGQPFGPPLRQKGLITAVAFSPDGKTLLLTGVADNKNTTRLWNAATGQPIGPPLQHEGLARAVAFSPDGKTVLIGCEDNTARVWEVATGKPLGLPLGHEGVVLAVAFSPDGKTALTGSADKTARLWDVTTGKPLGPPSRHQDWVHAVAFSRDGTTALTGSRTYIGRLEVAAPVQGEVERIALWAQVITGMELDEGGTVRRLPASTWHERYRRLQELGGPPLP
jgi:WD40 repeat protein/serine/threonine protein kinase